MCVAVWCMAHAIPVLLFANPEAREWCHNMISKLSWVGNYMDISYQTLKYKNRRSKSILHPAPCRSHAESQP
ncbi:uncharacterized protein EI97DRAFT_3592 [Westerdykella ornata]|uniref:Secreted protein n=1 Tax=Westerdykella ornata TaxID=318751 RepID=A0A6A6JVK3_WESOR|nr:uncharacterized protein EI97DRAFT_3592 [Westerdykella ornata]KAF2280632.1 hypothetical protein EI97DRAFT_3592 [Westerdykella ornata]